jgi:hypothetical protein
MEPSVSGAGRGDSLRVEYRYIQAMTCRGNRRVRVDADGRLFADEATRDCLRGEHWNGPWPDQPRHTLSPEEMGRLRRQIERAGIMELPAESVTPGRDGFREELDVDLGDHRHSIAFERAHPPRGFQQVRDTLFRLAGFS